MIRQIPHSVRDDRGGRDDRREAGDMGRRVTVWEGVTGGKVNFN